MAKDHDVAEPFDLLYARMVSLLRFVAHVRFRIPLPDAEGIVHDVFLKYLRDYRSVRDPDRWLAAAVANASRNHLRDRARESPLPPDAEERWEHPTAGRDLNAIATRLALGAVLQKLDGKCRDVLHRFHIQHESSETIARARGTTAGYVQLLLHLCRKRAREIYLSMTKVTREA